MSWRSRKYSSRTSSYNLRLSWVMTCNPTIFVSRGRATEDDGGMRHAAGIVRTDNLQADFPTPERVDHRRNAVGGVELARGGVDMGVRRPLADVEDHADFPAGLAGGGPLEDLALAVGQHPFVTDRAQQGAQPIVRIERHQVHRGAHPATEIGT